MVAFCHQCSQSLPFADIVIEDGQEEPAPGYECPHCHKPAYPEASNGAEEAKGENGEKPEDEFVLKKAQFLNSS